MTRLPRWASSIRFRLSLAYALAVFTAGSVLVAGLYLWQVRQLDEPIIMQTRPVVVVAGEDTFETELRVISQSDATAAVLTQLERRAYRESLNQLRVASFWGLGVLFVVAFGSGWVLSGWTVAPMRRMATVARDISARDLSARIDLVGPDDELKDLADTFDEMLDRLQNAFEDQRRFVQDTSHELRNPLAVARTNLELVIDEPGATRDELADAVRIAYGATGRLGGIVDDLVAQARLGVPVAARAPVDLEALAADVVAEQDGVAAGRSVRVELGAPPDAPVSVTGDEPAIRRAVTNLVANAVRLSPEGETVTVTLTRDGSDAVVAVTDRGPGIEPADQARVFERFWRGSDQGPGLGLGLSIVRQVVERHGGRVELNSEPGHGATFRLRFPMAVAGPSGGVHAAP
ncbi:MAG: sensor histidine kinase [Acidimicrobiales bacterium]